MLELNLVNLFCFSFLKNWSSTLNQLEQAPGKSECWLMKGQLRLLGSLLLIGNGWEVCLQSRNRANILLQLHCYLFLTNRNESSWMSFLFQRWSCEGSHCISTYTNKWSFCLHQTSIYCSTSFEKITLVWLFFHSHLAWVLGRLDILQALKSMENLCILVQTVLFPLLF